jgi:hypothetical protein
LLRPEGFQFRSRSAGWSFAPHFGHSICSKSTRLTRSGAGQVLFIASLRHAVANKMRHLVTQKAFEGKRIEQLDRLLPDDNLALPV